MLVDVDPTYNAVKLLHVFAVAIYLDSKESSGSENPASESRRLTYLAALPEGATLLPLTIMMSLGTEAQSFKNWQQNQMVTLCLGL